MPCLLGCIALSAPRFVLFLVWLFSDYIGDAYQSNFWPFMGFLFMPLTTLAYAFAIHQGGGHVTGFGWAVVITAVIVDLGLFGTGAKNARDRKVREITVKGEKVG
jgi:hypothetical protein